MKKIISLIVLSIFFFNFSYAEKYWSNKKDGTTNIGVAEILFNSQRSDYSSKKILPLHGIWFSNQIGFVHIYPDSIKENPSYKVSLIKPPRQFTNEQKKSFIFHGGTIEATIIPLIERSDEFNYYHKVWYIQNDGSYKYKTENDRLIIKGKNHFAVLDKQPEYKELPDNTFIHNFVRIYPTLSNKDFNIKKYLQTHSRDMADYDMVVWDSGDLLIRLNKGKARKDKKGKNKYIQINPNGAVSAGIYTWDQADKSKTIFESIWCENYQLYFQKKDEFKKIKSHCDPNKITYSTYLYYKFGTLFLILGALLLGVIIFYSIQFQRKNELANYNKKNKNKFKTYSEYKKHLQKLADIKWEKDQKEQEKERKAQEAIRKAQEEKELKEQKRLEAAEKRKEELKKKSQSVSVGEEDNDNLMGKIKRLKVLYKNGTLTKAEFEKAKNKLLK